MPSVINARHERTRLFFQERPAFMSRLVHEIEGATMDAQRLGLRLAIRLNGTSDIPWERIAIQAGRKRWANIFARFPSVQFYDYTKRLDRLRRGLFVHNVPPPSNYHLTFSLTDGNEADAIEAGRLGHNVAAVVTHETRDTLQALQSPHFVDGDAHDLRFIDRASCVVLLGAKGKARGAVEGASLVSDAATVLRVSGGFLGVAKGARHASAS